MTDRPTNPLDGIRAVAERYKAQGLLVHPALVLAVTEPGVCPAVWDADYDRCPCKGGCHECDPTPCDACKGTEAAPTHYGPDPFGIPTTHRGRREDCPGPDCGPADDEAPCAHESWDVTSEYSEGQKWKTWVKSRRCNDCGETLPQIREAEPHFPEHGAEAAPTAPTPLRWGLDDVEHADDDSVTVLLSDEQGAPYVLELDADRAVALRDTIPAPALSKNAQDMFRHALDLADDAMANRGDEYSDEDRSALGVLRDLANHGQAPTAEVAPLRGYTYRDLDDIPFAVTAEASLTDDGRPAPHIALLTGGYGQTVWVAVDHLPTVIDGMRGVAAKATTRAEQLARDAAEDQS